MRSRQTRFLTWIMAPLMVVLVAVVGTALARNYVAQDASLIEAERLIGMDVQNPQGEKLGEIEEIVLDRDRSRIVYAVVASGGFLGFGERSVAVPWSAFQMPTGSRGSTSSQASPRPDSSTERMGTVVAAQRTEPYLFHGEFLVLDIDAGTLKQAAFDQNGTWPASANVALFGGRPGIESGSSTSGSDDANPNRSKASGQNPGRDPEDTPGHEPGRSPGHEPGKSPGHDPYKSPGHAKDQPSAESSADVGARAGAQGQLVTVPDDPEFWSYKLSKLINLDVRNTQGEEVGAIDKILVDAKHGRVAYATISTDDYLEAGERLATVEWNTVTIDPANDRIMVEADRQTLTRLAFIEGQEVDPALSGAGMSSSYMGRDTGTASTSGTGSGVGTATGLGTFRAQLVDADQLLGIDVKNRNGEDLGEVEEIVLAREHEDIAYAVVALGGVLDVGEKKIAVPWQAFEIASSDPGTQRSTGSSSRTTQAHIGHLILDVDKARLEQSGFDDDGQWPESADLAGTTPQSPGMGSSSTDTQKQQPGQSSDRQKQKQKQDPSRSTAQHQTRTSRTAMGGGERTTVPNDRNFWSYKLSKLKDLDVRTSQGDDLGDIDKIMVDVREGRMAYVVVDANDLLASTGRASEGDSKVVVPWRVVSVSPTDERLIVKADRSTLQAAVFTDGQVPNLNDPLIAQRIEGAFGEMSEESSQVFGRPTTTTTTGLERFGHLDFSRTETMTGTVRSVDRARPNELMLVLDTGQGKTVNVFAGPSEYAQKQGMTFAPQTQITVVGVQAQTSATGTGNQQPVFVAKEIRASGQTLILIDNQGNPRWTTSTNPSATQQNPNPSDKNKDDDDKDMNKDKNKDD